MVTLNIKFALVLLLVTAFLYSDDSDPQQLKQDLIYHYSQIETYQADLEQSNYWPEMDVRLNSTGRIYYDTQHLKLEYSEPDGQFLLLDDLMVTMYDPGSNSAIISDGSGIDIRPLSIINKYWADSLITSFNTVNDTMLIALKTDVDGQVQFKVFEYKITELVYIDGDENSVTYSFKNEMINQVLPELIFQADLPEDVNLIDTRQ